MIAQLVERSYGDVVKTCIKYPHWYYTVRIKLNKKVKSKNFKYSEQGLIDAICYRDKLAQILHGEFTRVA